jgi:hypothetical protein
MLFLTTRRGHEKLEGVVRFEEAEGFVSRMRCYSFCPEVTRAVGEELGIPVRTGIYRYPTPEPGRSYGDPPRDAEGGEQ